VRRDDQVEAPVDRGKPALEIGDENPRRGDLVDGDDLEAAAEVRAQRVARGARARAEIERARRRPRVGPEDLVENLAERRGRARRDLGDVLAPQRWIGEVARADERARPREPAVNPRRASGQGTTPCRTGVGCP
jgi:hypothetical protein